MIRIDLSFFGQELVESIERGRQHEAEAALNALVAKSCVGAEWTGWFDWPKQRGFGLVDHVQSFVDSQSDTFDSVLVIGIGGSYLGARAVVEALSQVGDHRKPVYFLGQHLSTQSTLDTLQSLVGKRPIINVISKSGTTTEPAVAFRIVREWMVAQMGEEEFWRRVVCTTDQTQGALRQLADARGLTTFDVPADVGGRYSVLTAVGLVPLALAGFDPAQLMQGADLFFTSLKTSERQTVCRYAAARQVAYQEQGKAVELYAYAEPKALMFVEWLKQLFGESEGKKGGGILPAGLAYTTDLHSLGQLAQEGQRNLFETFLHFKPGKRKVMVPAGESADGLDYLVGANLDDINRAAVDATKLAHFDGGVPCIDLFFEEMNESTLGEMFAFFETACAISAAMQGVNPFDQPGVEAYKKNLFGLLGKPGFEALGRQLRLRLDR